MQKKIMIVDDDSRIVSLVSRYLNKEGFQVIGASSSGGALKLIKENSPQLILLDIMLGQDEEDGFVLLREIRSKFSIPVIMLTGKSDIFDKVVCLEIGADDYMTKPFEMRELLARIKAVSRRYQIETVKNKTENNNPIQKEVWEFSGFTLNVSEMLISDPKGGDIELTSGLFNLLTLLVRQSGIVLQREEISKHLKQRNANPFDRTIDVQISRLRHKLEKEHNAPPLFKSFRGKGYKFIAKSTRLQ